MGGRWTAFAQSARIRSRGLDSEVMNLRSMRSITKIELGPDTRERENAIMKNARHSTVTRSRLAPFPGLRTLAAIFHDVKS